MNRSAPDPEAQSDSTSFSQASTITDGQLQSQSTSRKHWAVVVQGLDESCALFQVALQLNDTGEQVWARIRNDVCSLSFARRLRTWLLMLFTTTVVGTGTIRQVWGAL